MRVSEFGRQTADRLFGGALSVRAAVDVAGAGAMVLSCKCHYQAHMPVTPASVVRAGVDSQRGKDPRLRATGMTRSKGGRKSTDRVEKPEAREANPPSTGGSRLFRSMEINTASVAFGTWLRLMLNYLRAYQSFT
jgi:hypothetical protein